MYLRSERFDKKKKLLWRCRLALQRLLNQSRQVKAQRSYNLSNNVSGMFATSLFSLSTTATWAPWFISLKTDVGENVWGRS